MEKYAINGTDLEFSYTTDGCKEYAISFIPSYQETDKKKVAILLDEVSMNLERIIADVAEDARKIRKGIEAIPKEPYLIDANFKNIIKILESHEEEPTSNIIGLKKARRKKEILSNYNCYLTLCGRLSKRFVYQFQIKNVGKEEYLAISQNINREKRSKIEKEMSVMLETLKERSMAKIKEEKKVIGENKVIDICAQLTRS